MLKTTMNTLPKSTFPTPLRIILSNGQKRWLCTDILFMITDFTLCEKEVTSSMFEDFESVFYVTPGGFSVREIVNYLTVLRKMCPYPDYNHLYDIREHVSGLSPRDALRVLEAIDEQFFYLEKYRSKETIDLLLSKLPEHPGHCPIYNRILVRSEYRRRFIETKDENLREVILDYILSHLKKE